MALSNVGGGYQYTDGSSTEVTLGVQPAPAVVDTAAVLTVAQLTTGLINSNPAGAINLTLPLVADLNAVLVNAHIDSCFDFSVNNLSGANAITLITSATGWNLVGSLVIAGASAGMFRARKATETFWALYRIS